MIDIIIPLCNLLPLSLNERIASINFAFHRMYANDENTNTVYFVEQSLDGKKYYLDRLPDHKKVKKICIKHKIFNKAWCINVAAKQSQADYLALSDCDMFMNNFSGRRLQNWLESFNYKWGFAWSKIHYTSRAGKDKIFTDSFPDHKDNQVDDRFAYPRPGYSEGGIVLVKRDFFIRMGMCNECIQKLGGPDNELALRLHKTAGHYPGAPYVIYHLWHPTIDRKATLRGEKNLIILKQTQLDIARANTWLKKCDQGNKKSPLAARREFLS